MTGYSLVSPAGQPLLAEARRTCSSEVSALARQLKIDMAAAFAVPLDVLANHRLPVTDMQAHRVAVPMLLGTGLADRLIPPQRQFGAVAALCAAGNAVTWRAYEGVVHNGSPHAAFGAALAFARSALAGQPSAGNCASVAPPSVTGALAPRLVHKD